MRNPRPTSKDAYSLFRCRSFSASLSRRALIERLTLVGGSLRARAPPKTRVPGQPGVGFSNLNGLTIMKRVGYVHDTNETRVQVAI